MDHRIIVQQTKMEAEALRHVTRALEVALAWVVEGRDLSRKLSSVRFATELFQRQIERLFAMEELDGYMERVCRIHPEWSDGVRDFKREHEQFRAMVRKLLFELDFAPAMDLAKLDKTCTELQSVIQQILDHGNRESELLVASLMRDTGGEG